MKKEFIFAVMTLTLFNASLVSAHEFPTITLNGVLFYFGAMILFFLFSVALTVIAWNTVYSYLHWKQNRKGRYRRK